MLEPDVLSYISMFLMKKVYKQLRIENVSRVSSFARSVN